VGKAEGKIPLGRPKGRWNDNIRKDLRETEWKVVDWVTLGRDRYVPAAGYCEHRNEN